MNEMRFKKIRRAIGQFLCFLGFHKYQGCKCIRCPSIRNQEHKLSEECVCHICNSISHDFRPIGDESDWEIIKASDTIKASSHIFQNVTYKFIERCSRCNKERENTKTIEEKW